jgi:hypothetical protein
VSDAKGCADVKGHEVVVFPLETFQHPLFNSKRKKILPQGLEVTSALDDMKSSRHYRTARAEALHRSDVFSSPVVIADLTAGAPLRSLGNPRT